VIDVILLGAGLVVIAGLAFVVSIRLGILVGRRLDRSIEARALLEDETGDDSALEPAAAHQNRNPGHLRGREEHRVE
jgi:hypothetical protein